MAEKKKASELKPGDRIGRNVRIHHVLTRDDGSVAVAWKMQGSKAPGMSRYQGDDMVQIFNDRRGDGANNG